MRSTDSSRQPIQLLIQRPIEFEILEQQLMLGTTETAFDRDSWAKSYAHRHFETDAGVQRIFYLPTNSPPRQIRLLEINSLIPDLTPLEPIDFGVEVGGADSHSLYVLDVTPAQWGAIQKGELPLPRSWTLDAEKELYHQDS